MTRSGRRLGILGAALLWAGCASAAGDRQTEFMAENAELRTTAAELRLRVRDLARPFGGVLEETADAVIASTDDLDLRARAVRLKIDAIPAMHEALFQRDPLEAVLDAAMLLMQMKHFATDGDRPPLTEDQRRLVLDAIEAMQADLEEVMEQAGADMARADATWAMLDRWAREAPVGDSFASRRTAVSRLAEFTSSTGTGALGAVSDLSEDIGDLMARLDVYSAALAKQARWQAELLLLELLEEEGAIPASIPHVPPVSVRVAELPPDLGEMVATAIATIHSERLDLQQWASEDRREVQRFLTSEREAILAAVASEREIVSELVQDERKVVLETTLAAVSAEREATFAELETVLRRSIVEARREVVDHLVARLALLAGGILAAAFVGAVLLMVIWRRLSTG